MLQDHPNKTHLKQSFFSKPPQYPLEVNSVYRPKFSSIASDKFHNIPFYHREDKMQKVTQTEIERSFEMLEECQLLNDNGNFAKINGEIEDVEAKNTPMTLKATVSRIPLENKQESMVTVDSDGAKNKTINLATQLLEQNPTDVKQSSNISNINTTKNSSILKDEKDKRDINEEINNSNKTDILKSSHLADESLLNSVSKSQTFVSETPLKALNVLKKNPTEGIAQQAEVLDTGENVNYGIAPNGSSKEYFVMVHVDAGATFSIRSGEHIQQIPGPATVRLVSNNSPPLPMPMQVPAGYLVQQIVDEEGILTHVILSLFPGPPSAYMQDGCPLMSGVQSGFQGFPPTTAALFLSQTPRHTLQSPLPVGSTGVNVIISPKTSPGLAVAGPMVAGPWPSDIPVFHTAPSMTNEDSSAGMVPDENNAEDLKSEKPKQILCRIKKQSGVVKKHKSSHSDMPSAPDLSDKAKHSPIKRRRKTVEDLEVKEEKSEVDENGSESHPKSPKLSASQLDDLSSIILDVDSRGSDISQKAFNHSSSEIGLKSSMEMADPTSSEVAVTKRLRRRRIKTPDHLSTDTKTSCGPGRPTGSPSNMSYIPTTSEMSTKQGLDITKKASKNKAGSASAVPGKNGTGKKETSPGQQPKLEATPVEQPFKKPMEEAAQTTSTPICLVDVKPLEASFVPVPQFQPVVTGSPSIFSHYYAPPTVPLTSDVVGLPGSFGFFNHPQHLFQSHPSPAFLSPFTPQSYFMPHPSNMHQYSFQFPAQPVSQPMQPFPPQLITPCFSEEDCSAIERVLSKVTKPKVSAVDFSSVTINLSLPDNLAVHETSANVIASEALPVDASSASQPIKAETSSVEAPVDAAVGQGGDVGGGGANGEKYWSIPPSDLRFALYLAESNDVFNCVYFGEATCILLQDLRPAFHYFLKACCIYENIRGSFSESVEFITLATKPFSPRPPIVISKTKNSLNVRWSPPVDNGSRIISYSLQCAIIPKAGAKPNFQVCYTGTQRFQKVTHLLPSTSYLLRVSAFNAHGQSPWSDAVSAQTNGLPPPSPDPPRMIAATTNTLHLAWEPRLNEGKAVKCLKPIFKYILEIQEAELRQPFKQAFEGDGIEYRVERLRRNTLYRFRLAAVSSDGLGQFSEIVAFRTLPDFPSPPKSLRIRGRVRPYQMNLCWTPPEDDGGLPVQNYRLEVELARIPSSLLQQFPFPSSSSSADRCGQPSSKINLSVTDNEGCCGSERYAGVCLPLVIADSHDTSVFTCTPPASHLLQIPTTNLAAKYLGIHGAPCAPIRVPASPLAIQGHGLDSVAYGSSAENSDNEAASCSSAASEKCWYAIYEGGSKEVAVSNLTPGLSLLFRVRASNSHNSKEHQSKTSWGSASAKPLKITMPAVPPMNPPSNLRLLGKMKPNEIKLTWNAPTCNGGAPIICYEVWQSLTDQVSNNPVNAPIEPNATIGKDTSDPSCQLASTASLENLSLSSSSVSLTVEPTAVALSAPSSARSSPKHSKGSARSRHKMDELGLLVYNGPERECCVVGLCPGCLFSFRVRARNTTGWSDWSTWQTVSTAAAPPSAPLEGPRVLPMCATAVAVSWEAVEVTNGAPITEYRVEWEPNAPEPEQTCTPEEAGEMALSQQWRRSRNPSAASTCSNLIGSGLNNGLQMVYSGHRQQFEMYNLQPASRLMFRVCAVNSAGASGWSPWRGCVMPASQPDQPVGLSIDKGLCHSSPSANNVDSGAEGMQLMPVPGVLDAVSMTTAHLIWVAPPDNGCPITNYNLEVTKSSTQPAVTTLLKLLPLYVDGEELMSQVCIETESLSSSSKEEEDEILRDICIQDPSSVSPSIGVASGNSSEMSSSDLLLPISSRPIMLRPRSLLDYVRYTLIDLEMETKYRIRVQAINAMGVGAFSNTLNFTTLPPIPTAPGITCLSSNASGIKLQWSLPHEPLTSQSQEENRETQGKQALRENNLSKSNPMKYLLEISRKPETKGWTMIFEGTQTVFKARKLTEATNYYFRVAAVNVSGIGDYSSVLCIKTAYAAPPPVKAPAVSDVDKSTCHVEWPALEHMGQDPLVYLLQLMRVSSNSADSTNNPITVYRGAKNECTISNLESGIDYIARVQAIRLCQENIDQSSPTTPLNQPQMPVFSNLNPPHINQELIDTSTKITPARLQYRLLELPGHFSVGTAFSTLSEQSSYGSGFHLFSLFRHQGTSFPTGHLIKHVLSTLLHRINRNFRPFNDNAEHINVGEPTGRRSLSLKSVLKLSWPPRLTDKQLACCLLLVFGFLTVLIAWGFQHLIIHDDSPTGQWPASQLSSVEESVSSARAAFWANNNRRIQHQ